MKKIYITFSGAPYEDTTRRIVEDSCRLGADEVWVYDDRWLMEQEFYRLNQWLWQHPHKRGFGWYAWKPFIIWHAMSRLDEGDVVLYTDADCYPIAPFGRLFDLCAADGGMMIFASEGHRQWEWCKRDCYVVMGQDVATYYDVAAGVARFMLFQCGPWRVAQFLMEWLTYSVNPLANTFDGSTLKAEMAPFIEHRAEQAILSNLGHRYRLKFYREADEAGNGTDRDRGLYGQLFQQVNPHEAKVTAEPVGSSYFNVGSRSVNA